MSLAAAIARFLASLSVERNLSPNTVAAYRSDLRKLTFALGDASGKTLSLSALSLPCLESFLQAAARQGAAATSQARLRASVRQLVLFCQGEEQLVDLDIDRLAAPKLRRKAPFVMSAAQAVALLDGMPDDGPRALRDRAALELLYGAGLRASEVCALKLPGLSLTRGLVMPLGKGRRERAVPLGQKACAAVARYLEDGRPALLAKRRSPFVFIGNSGKALSRMALYNIVRRQALRAGVAGQTPHALRHAFATHLLDGGANLRVVQKLLGHRSIATTEIYTHVVASHLRRSIDQHHPLSRRVTKPTKKRGGRGD